MSDRKVIDIRAARPPAELSPEARKLWSEILDDYEIDDAGGLAILRQLCEALERLRECQAAIKADGVTVKGYRGQPRPHPLLKTESECRRQMLACYRALNLDPLE